MSFLINSYRSSGKFGAHAYWRIFMSNTNGASDFLNLAQIQFLNHSGTLIPATGGTVLFSTQTASNEAFYCFDGTPLANSWLSTSPTNQYVGYQFTSPVAPETVTLWGPNSGNILRCPLNCTMDYSDNGSSWTTAISFSMYGPVFSSSQTFPTVTPPAGSHRFWRVFCSDNNGGSSFIILDEIQFRATPGGANLTAGATASYGGNTVGRVQYSSDVGGDEAYNAFTGTGALWASNGTTNQYNGWVFPSATPVQEVALTSGNGQAARAPKNMAIQYSDDGTTWTTQKTLAAQTGWASTGETRVFAAI